MTPTLDIQQPQPFDIVSERILIAGNATAFEGSLTVRVEEGHAGVESFVTVGSLGLRQFQGAVDIPPDTPFQLDRLFVTLADDGATADGPQVTIPVLYGPRILPGYKGWQPYTVQAGDTLTAIAQSQYGTSDFAPILRANQPTISDANLIFPGQVLRIPRNDI